MDPKYELRVNILRFICNKTQNSPVEFPMCVSHMVKSSTFPTNWLMVF